MLCNNGSSEDVEEFTDKQTQSGFCIIFLFGTTGSIKTTTFTAANGEGYFADTQSGNYSRIYLLGSRGIVSVSDYTRTFQTNNLQLHQTDLKKYGRCCIWLVLQLVLEGQALTFVYVDGTEGWKCCWFRNSTGQAGAVEYICALLMQQFKLWK